jgi:hypothetical protein
VDYYRQGGILPAVLRRLVRESSPDAEPRPARNPRRNAPKRVRA